MGQTNINIRMDEDLKKAFATFCSTVGMNMTTAFCVFAKQCVREQRIPFEITAATSQVVNLESDETKEAKLWYDEI